MAWFRSKKPGFPAAGDPDERSVLLEAREDDLSTPGDTEAGLPAPRGSQEADSASGGGNERLSLVGVKESMVTSENEGSVIDLSEDHIARETGVEDQSPKEEDAMRNMVMMEEMAKTFAIPQVSADLEGRNNELIMSATKAMGRHANKAAHKKSKAAAPSPRYIPSPSRANPFMVHTHPVSTLIEDLEEIEAPRQAEAARTKPQAEQASQQNIESNANPPHDALPSLTTKTTEIAPVTVDSAKQQSPTAVPQKLSGMESQLSIAKSVVAYDLEQLRTRRTKLEAEHAEKQRKLEKELADNKRDLERIDQQIAQKVENVHRIDDAISANTLLMEQISSIDPALLASKGAHHKAAYRRDGADKSAYKSARWNLDDPNVCRQQDVLDVVNADPDKIWKAGDVHEKLPASKQAHGQNVVVAAMLSNLAKDNKIARVGRGDYQAIK